MGEEKGREEEKRGKQQGGIEKGKRGREENGGGERKKREKKQSQCPANRTQNTARQDRQEGDSKVQKGWESTGTHTLLQRSVNFFHKEPRGQKKIAVPQTRITRSSPFFAMMSCLGGRWVSVGE